MSTENTSFNHRPWLLCAAIVLFTVSMAIPSFSQSEKLIYKQLLRPHSAEYYHVPIGLCEDYPEETTTLEIIRKDMELLKRSGINLLRISFGWDGIETEKDKYNWLFWDDYVKIAAEEYGITLIPYICYTPSWNSTGDTTNFWNHTPKDYEEFGQFTYDLVTRYKKWIKSWELWNEPDISAYWSGNAADLAKLTKIGAEAVKRADSDAIVVLAGLAGHTEFTRALFKDHGISEFVDVVNCHNYFETWGGQPIEQIVPYLNSLAEIILKWGNNQSLWVAEVGYSTFRKEDGYVSDWYHSIYNYEHTPKFQAVQLVRTLSLILSTNKVAAIAWYEIKDLPPQENVIGDVNNRNLGVANVDHSPKPAEKALSFFNNLFATPSKCIDDKVLVRRAIGSESEVHAFEMENGDVIVVGWLQTYAPGKEYPKNAGDLKDTRSETISVTIPSKLAGRAILYNEVGNESQFKKIDRKGYTTTLTELQLAGGEVSIIKITK